MRTVTSAHRRGRRAALLVAAASALTAHAQPVWSLGPSAATLRTDAFADDPQDLEPPCQISDLQSGVNVPFLGRDAGNRAYAGCAFLIATCPLTSVAFAEFYVTGLNTSTVTIEWRTYAWVRNNCDRIYIASAIADLSSTITVTPTGLPPATPVTVNYRWNGYSDNFTVSEALGEDSGRVVNTRLILNGSDLPGGFFDLPGVSGVLVKPDQYGVFGSTIGADSVITVEADLDNTISDPPILNTVLDVGFGSFSGSITLSLTGPPPAVVRPTPPALEFGVDLGGDREISDYNLDGDGVFDPGDTYPWYGPALPAGGADGPRNDLALFPGLISDPPPSPPNPPVTGPPACAGGPPDPFIPNYFDLDDFDAINLSLSGIINPGQPLAAPIQTQPSPCLFGIEHLAISYDDDSAAHYISQPVPPCSIPMFDLSPAGNTWGQSGRRDEVIGVELIPLSLLSANIVGAGSGLDERRLHRSLAPSPDVVQDDDDDVDGLDVYDDAAVCDTWYFSVDHEATFNHPLLGGALRPGVIYQAVPGGVPIPVIDSAIHLGLTPGVDIDAFEFVLVSDPVQGVTPQLALVFSVDDDDPLTPADESAALDPRVLYISQFTGVSVPLSPQPLDDDIDAITAYRLPFTTYTVPLPCPGDANGDRRVDAADLSVLLGQFGQSVTPNTGADFNGDGLVNAADLSVLLANFGRIC